MTEQTTHWVALVHVKAIPGVDALAGNVGAFAHIVAVANSRDDYEMHVAAALTAADLALVQIEDLEPYEDALQGGRISADLLEEAEGHAREEGDVVWGTFHGYPVEEGPEA